MGIEAIGKLHTIFETKHVSDRFTKREFVLEIADNPKYPQTVLFQLSGDRCEQLNRLAIGDDVLVEFSLRGREWKSPSGEVKFFNSLDVWKIERIGIARAAQTSSAGGQQTTPAPASPPLAEDDIPFISSAFTHEPNPIARVLR